MHVAQITSIEELMMTPTTQEDLQKIRIDVELIKAQLAAELGAAGQPGNLSKSMEKISTSLLDLSEIMSGSGDPDKPGLLTRIDRLEQSESSRRWHIRALWTSLLGGMVAAVLTLL